MCGVIGLMSERERTSLGAVAGKMLRMLEYRGYDSTGGIIQKSNNEIFFAKDVGSPTIVTKKYNFDQVSGKIFCGQVRWATFGMVDALNAQPHQVSCHTNVYGAHNGNVTNCDQLKVWLTEQGHHVLSNNDGEMVVHAVEHFFAAGLKAHEGTRSRRELLREAVVAASKILTGSYAAIIVDPVEHLMVAIKAGSSLYLGKGISRDGGAFIATSSDLASVLSQTKILYPMSEGEFAIFDHQNIEFYRISDGTPIAKSAKRSKLTVEQTELREPYRYFMEQDIHSQAASAEQLIRLYRGDSPLLKKMLNLADVKVLQAAAAMKQQMMALEDVVDEADFARTAEEMLKSNDYKQMALLAARLWPTPGCCQESDLAFESAQAPFLEDLARYVSENRVSVASSWPAVPVRQGLKIIDNFFFKEEMDEITQRLAQFTDMIGAVYNQGRSIYMVACGTSYHAAKTAAYFFDRIAGVPVYPLLPGEFRGQYEHSLKNGDLLIGISQSGETKDLIDIFNLAKQGNKDLRFISIVNNTNSTLPQEKSDLYLPLCCGPEIAVPATKSFMNQLVVLYILAVRVRELLLKHNGSANDRSSEGSRQITHYRDLIDSIPQILRQTVETTSAMVEATAKDLFQAPSIHILATGLYGIAKEGALKIREVVLNHTEGFESSEFKHGPNTILGVNTVFGMESIIALLQKCATTLEQTLQTAQGQTLDANGVVKLMRGIVDYAFRDQHPRNFSENELTLFKTIFEQHNFFDHLYANYPLVFVTGSSEREVNLTISQINTHKIRGANIFVIAEENARLRDAIRPVSCERFTQDYRSNYIVLPKGADDILTCFSSTVVLQLLALRMSVLKMHFLDALEIADHGVHPDSPKNVSKSITVD